LAGGGPGLALLLTRVSTSARLALALSCATVLAGSLWSAYLYLWHNEYRPLAPVFDPNLTRPKPMPLTAELSLRLAHAERVHLIGCGDDDPLSSLLLRPEPAVYTAGSALRADAYNLISLPDDTRHAPLNALATTGTFVAVPFSAKTTAGVEPLGRMGPDPGGRAYFGIGGKADEPGVIPNNRSVLVWLRAPTSSPATVHATVFGLNPSDAADLRMYVLPPDGSVQTLAMTGGNGEFTFTLPGEPDYLYFQLMDRASGRVHDTIRLPFQAAPMVKPITAPPLAPGLLFAEDLVLAAPSEHVAITGIDASEGPFPQWQLPRIRWLRQPSARLSLNPLKGLKEWRVTLSARLHVRTSGTLEILVDDQVVERVILPDATTWRETTLTVPFRPEGAAVELRDAKAPPVPDWNDYLRRYPDVRRYLEQTRRDPAEGAIEHYETSGRREGRTMRMIDAPAVPVGTYRFMFRTLRVEGVKS
jgi:hypothetical protein